MRNYHDLYKTGDADIPSEIQDRNGEVVLSLCKKCKKGEIELLDHCDYHPNLDGPAEPIGMSMEF
jgi:hypothetical protein